ncbi:hypothetical protein H0266_14280 [Halobacillus locisalis]|uniref:DUF3899 domain-containing protein n=1 Tax=Halobacillus locisalis TaxID=220753 RepID=A0A838CVS0_9BACI|nr:hypothetical protein [Halobacillus locisalis]MBA2176060.1 hypothetical protein [Halobacillus locisalis]
MLKRMQSILLIVSLNYLLLTVLSLIFNSRISMEFLGNWGLLTGLVILISALPLHKVVYYGGRGMAGSQTPEIPPDEHIHEKVKKKSKRSGDFNRFQDSLTISGVIVLVISFMII